MTDLYIKGPDALKLLSRSRRQQLRDVRGRQGQAVRRRQPRRLRDRRRDPLLPGRGAAQPRRAPVGAQLGAVPRRDGRLRRHVRAGRALGREPDRPEALPLPGPGADRARGAGEGHRRAAAGDQVLQHGPSSRSPATRCGRCITACPACPASSSSGPPSTARTSGQRSSRPARSSAFARSARASTRRTRSSRAGSRARCRRSSPATSMKAYREWLPANGYEGTGSLGGSYYSDDIADYYLTPVRARLRTLRQVRPRLRRARGARADDPDPQRKKVTLAWNGDDVARAMGTMFQEDGRAKYIDLPALQLLDVAERQDR